MNGLAHSIVGRILALWLVGAIGALGCRPSHSLAPANGIPQFQERGLVAVPGGVVNAAGGNLMIRRLDMSIDTLLGTHEIRATYNALAGEWLWNFEITYDGATFLDASGARHVLAPLGDGDPVAGTVWTKRDSDTVETRGGLGYHFDASGRLSHVAWSTADYPRIRYAWSPSEVEIAQCSAASICIPFLWVALDSAGRPSSLTDLRTGRRAEFDFDASGRLVAARSPADLDEARPGVRYEYAPFGTLLTAIVNSEGERIEYAYQANRRIRDVIQIGEGDPAHRFEFHAARANTGYLYPTIHTNPLGGRTRYAFDAERRLLSVKRPDTGELATTQWSGLRPALHVGPNGATTETVYASDNLVLRVEPSGNVVVISYSAVGVNTAIPAAPALDQVVDSLGLVEQWSYDAQGRPISHSSGTGDVVSVSYGPVTVESATGPAGAVREFPIYGIHGHWLEMTGDFDEQRAFDPVGNVLVPATLERGGGVLERGFDADRNLASLRVAMTDEGQVQSDDEILTPRRSDGQLRSISRPGGADHDFVYDALGRLVERSELASGEWRTTHFEYDAAGNVSARSLANGMREEFDRDLYGRVILRRALRDGVLEGEAEYVYQQGDLVTVYDSVRDATESYGYDQAGRRSWVQYAEGETLAVEYDLRSRIIRETFEIPSLGAVRILEYGYDLADRRISVAVDGEVLVEDRFVDGRLASTLHGNGLERLYVYDAIGRLVASTTTNAAASVVETTAVEHSVEISPPRQQIAVSTATPLATTTEEYWLGLGGGIGDPDRAVGKRVFGWAAGGESADPVVYDELSNRVSSAAGDVYAYNAERNRLESATFADSGEVIDYTYDAAGFATSRGGVPITWTATGRMASHGDDRIEWDMQDRPISRTVDGVTRDFSLFGGRVERDPATGALGALGAGSVSIAFAGPERRYRHLDFRTNVSFVTDESGSVVQHYQYAAYGIDSAYGVEEGASFVGRSSVGELMLLGDRMYDPAVGRFLSPDPVLQLVNQYSYTLGNPVWYADPDGRDSLSMSPATGAAAATGGLIVATGSIMSLGGNATAAAVLWGGIGFGLAGFIFAIAIAIWLSRP